MLRTTPAIGPPSVLPLGVKPLDNASAISAFDQSARPDVIKLGPLPLPSGIGPPASRQLAMIPPRILGEWHPHNDPGRPRIAAQSPRIARPRDRGFDRIEIQSFQSPTPRRMSNGNASEVGGGRPATGGKVFRYAKRSRTSLGVIRL